MILNTSIKYMDYYIPQKSIAVEDILSMNINSPMLSDKNCDEFFPQFKEQSGLDRISVFDLNANLAGIISGMMDKLFETTGISPSEISYLVCGNPDLMEDNISAAHFVHKKFHLENAVILPLFQPCASTIIAMGLSRRLLGIKGKEYMLVLSARKSPNLQGRFVGFTVMGDGISLVLIENEPGEVNITSWSALNLGISSYDKIEYPDKIPNESQFRMNIIRNGVSFLQKHVQGIDIKMDDLDAIIHPNTNYDVWYKVYSSLLDIAPDKFYLDNISYGGHINDVDLVRNTKDYIEKNKFYKRAIKLLVFGIDLVKSLDINYHVISLDIKFDC